MSTRTNRYPNRHYDGWGANPIGFMPSEPKQIQKDYYSKFLDSLYNGFVLPLVIIKENKGRICVDITQKTLTDMPFNRFAEEVAKKYGKPESLYIRVKLTDITEDFQATIKLWTLYGTMFCRYCFLNDVDLPTVNKPVAYVGKPIHCSRIYSNLEPRALSLKNLKLRDEILKIDWEINNKKEIILFEYFMYHNIQYKIHKNLYQRYMNYVSNRHYLDEESSLIDSRYANTVETLEPKHSVICKLYGTSLDNTLPETYFRYKSIWINHPFDNTKNKKVEYTQLSTFGGDFKFKSFISRQNLKPTYAIEKLSNSWILTSDNDIKRVLSDTAEYTLCDVTEEQTWIQYNINNPLQKTVHQELITHKEVMSEAELDKMRDDVEIEYTSFTDTYSDDYEENMCSYENSIDRHYAEAEAEEEAEYANLWEEELTESIILE